METAIVPDGHTVDAAYVGAQLLVTRRREYGVDLIGPTRPDYRWRPRQCGLRGESVRDRLGPPTGDLPRRPDQRELVIRCGSWAQRGGQDQVLGEGFRSMHHPRSVYGSEAPGDPRAPAQPVASIARRPVTGDVARIPV